MEERGDTHSVNDESKQSHAIRETVVHNPETAAVGCPHCGLSVCAPYTTEFRVDFDFVTGSPNVVVCVTWESHSKVTGSRG